MKKKKVTGMLAATLLMGTFLTACGCGNDETKLTAGAESKEERNHVYVSLS